MLPNMTVYHRAKDDENEKKCQAALNAAPPILKKPGGANSSPILERIRPDLAEAANEKNYPFGEPLFPHLKDQDHGVGSSSPTGMDRRSSRAKEKTSSRNSTLQAESAALAMMHTVTPSPSKPSRSPSKTQLGQSMCRDRSKITNSFLDGGDDGNGSPLGTAGTINKNLIPAGLAKSRFVSSDLLDVGKAFTIGKGGRHLRPKDCHNILDWEGQESIPNHASSTSPNTATVSARSILELGTNDTLARTAINPTASVTKSKTNNSRSTRPKRVSKYSSTYASSKNLLSDTTRSHVGTRVFRFR